MPALVQYDAFTFTRKPIGKTSNHRSRGDTPWRAQTVRRVPRGGSHNYWAWLTALTHLRNLFLSTPSHRFIHIHNTQIHSQYTPTHRFTLRVQKSPPARVPVKRHRGEPGHTRDTPLGALAHTGHTDTRITRMNLTSITHKQPDPQTHTRTNARRARSRPSQRSPPDPAVDSEKTTPSDMPSEPDPLPPPAPRGQSAYPRVL